MDQPLAGGIRPAFAPIGRLPPRDCPAYGRPLPAASSAVSRSPRRLLRRAADALRELEGVLTDHPAAKAELTEQLGQDGLRRLEEAAEVIAGAAERLERAAPGE